MKMTGCIRCANGDTRTADGFHSMSTGRYARCSDLPPYDSNEKIVTQTGTPQHAVSLEVDACIDEIEWFATRKKNLSETVYGRDIDWASQLVQDIVDLRKALQVERAQSVAAIEELQEALLLAGGGV